MGKIEHPKIYMSEKQRMEMIMNSDSRIRFLYGIIFRIILDGEEG